ncbi:MAG: DUF6502 family protein [Pelagimonas sp.]|uniref:DUF6502 family protein n=1 Tax=Pelagimonas sp. TaxID=2073170 RepID=UPI003D6AE86E
MCNLHIMPAMFDSILAALARLMVARGVAFSELSERLKGHYVQAAQEQAAREKIGGKITDSRLSVMTGLQRRDIARLRAFERKAPRANPLSRLVAKWQSDPDLTQNGLPIALPRNGPAPSFEALARDIRQDIHPRTMLDTLQAAGTVAVGQDITLIEAAYVPLRGSDEQMSYLSENTGDHLMAACENVLGADPAHFERAVHYTGLTQTQIDALDTAYQTGQTALLTDLNTQASAMKAQNDNTGTHRFRAGAYFFSTKVARQ